MNGFGIEGIEEAAMEKALQHLSEADRAWFRTVYAKEYKRIMDEVLAEDARRVDEIPVD
jgi:hypothetical protein